MSYIDHTSYGDHDGYADLYQKALQTLSKAPGDALVVEVGTRAGGSAMTLMDAINDTKPRYLMTIDPYGTKPYETRDYIVYMDYTDEMYRQAMVDLAVYAKATGTTWTHYKMRSLDWMERFGDVKMWSEKVELPVEFALVHLDGDHSDKTVRAELEWFLPRMVSGGLIVVDDADQLTFVPDGATVEANRLWLYT